MSRYIGGRKWLYRLSNKDEDENKSPPLFYSDPGKFDLRGKLVVCLRTENKDKKVRLFSLFDSYADFHGHHLIYVIEHRDFYEVIFGFQYQKSHFDIDMYPDTVKDSKYGLDFEADRLLKELVQVIIDIYNDRYKVQINVHEHIYIYSSSSHEKKSFHVIVNGYCHENNKEAEFLHKECMRRMTNPYKECIDSTVYKSVQQFRIFGCQKVKSYRPKIKLVSFTDIKDVKHDLVKKSGDVPQYFFDMCESLITNTTGCELLPKLLIEDVKKSSLFTTSSIDDQTFSEALSIMRSLHGTVSDSGIKLDFPFEVRDIGNNCLNLKRIRRSFCPICCRTHDSDNAFLTVLKGHIVYFWCFRNSSKPLRLGIITSGLFSISSDGTPSTLSSVSSSSSSVSGAVSEPHETKLQKTDFEKSTGSFGLKKLVSSGDLEKGLKGVSIGTNGSLDADDSESSFFSFGDGNIVVLGEKGEIKSPPPSFISSTSLPTSLPKSSTHELLQSTIITSTLSSQSSMSSTIITQSASPSSLTTTTPSISLTLTSSPTQSLIVPPVISPAISPLLISQVTSPVPISKPTEKVSYPVPISKPTEKVSYPVSRPTKEIPPTPPSPFTILFSKATASHSISYSSGIPTLSILEKRPCTTIPPTPPTPPTPQRSHYYHHSKPKMSKKEYSEMMRYSKSTDLRDLNIRFT